MIDKGVLAEWEKEALEFKADIEDMNEAMPVIELIDKLLLTIGELLTQESVDSNSGGIL